MIASVGIVKSSKQEVEKMKIILFTQFLMKVTGILPIFSNTQFKYSRSFEIIKFIIILLAPFYVTMSTFAFAFMNLSDLKQMTIAMYVAVGCVMGVSLQICFWFESKNVRSLIDNMERLVNERKFSLLSQYQEDYSKRQINSLIFRQGIAKSDDFGESYERGNANSTKWSKKICKIWSGIVFPMVTGPFVGALVDFILGCYSISSWKMIYPTTM